MMKLQESPFLQPKTYLCRIRHGRAIFTERAETFLRGHNKNKRYPADCVVPLIYRQEKFRILSTPILTDDSHWTGQPFARSPRRSLSETAPCVFKVKPDLFSL